MFYARRFSLLILCTAVLLTMAVGCKNVTENDNAVTTTSETEKIAETTTEKVTETELTTQIPEPEPEPNYEWVIEPGIYSGDIQPVQGWIVKRTNIALVILDDKYLIDYNGNVKFTLPDKPDNPNIKSCSLCGACDIIDCVGGCIKPDTYEIVEHMGHGGYFIPSYIYDPETGFICYRDYGAYTEVTENIPYATVSEGVRRPATTADHIANDYAYDLTGRYGIIVNSELVVPFEYDEFAIYDDFGIAKLKKDGKWTLFNSEGKAITGNDYLDFCATSDGYIALNRDGKWGYVDLEGNIVIDHVFNKALPSYCGKAWVKTDAGWGVIKIDEPTIMTEEEAKQIIYDKYMYDEFGERTNLVTIDITPNDMKFYECVGYGFDVNRTYANGYESSGSFFVHYDGTIFTPQYYSPKEITD